MQIAGELPTLHVKFLANILLGQRQGGTRIRGIEAVVQHVLVNIDLGVVRDLKSPIWCLIPFNHKSAKKSYRLCLNSPRMKSSLLPLTALLYDLWLPMAMIIFPFISVLFKNLLPQDFWSLILSLFSGTTKERLILLNRLWHGCRELGFHLSRLNILGSFNPASYAFLLSGLRIPVTLSWTHSICRCLFWSETPSSVLTSTE